MTDLETMPERFRTKIGVLDTECWEWTAYRDRFGYGRYRLKGETRLAHQVAFEQALGPVPIGLELDHFLFWTGGCVGPACVNPDHLRAVTHAENLLHRRSPQREKTHCKAGHPYDAENTYLYRGGRHCRACNRDRKKQKAGETG